MSTVVSMRNTSDHAVGCGPADGHAREWRLEKLLDDARLTGSPVGQSPAWYEVLKKAIQVAATDTTTCLQGESGVGKEVVHWSAPGEARTDRIGGGRRAVS